MKGGKRGPRTSRGAIDPNNKKLMMSGERRRRIQKMTGQKGVHRYFHNP